MNDLVRLLFQELVDLPQADREKVFAQRQVEPELRAEVESLLSFDSADDDSLTRSVVKAAEDAIRSAGSREFGSCGPYRLVRLLGSGGMGAVWLAERIDGEVQQKVAVKLLRSGADRPAWRERFLQERQLLSNLNHPSIAHMIDAGHTADGRPYLVMEYVDGVPIDVYAAKLDLRDRLKLFLPVCDGVSHAHRHLIIHRDLKPSNILVDSSGQPKLLDFGIAKPLDDTANATQTVERLLTPNYASPEQLRGTSQTTATDVYSLGAVLYELLTGRSPHESDAPGGQAIDVITGARQVAPPSRLNRTVTGDIDCIVAKALRIEPEERYVSVEAFANDVRAYLESRPVQARSGDRWYRTRKFIRRYWIPVAAAALAVAGLSAGLVVANRQRAIAERRFVQVRQLANRLFDIDVEVRQFPGTTKARQMIVDTSLEYLRKVAAEVHNDPELALEVGNAYMRVGRVQGVPISANLGQLDKADQSLQTAEDLIQSVLRVEPENRTAVLRSAQVAHDRMILAGMRSPPGPALDFAKKSAAGLEKYLATGNLDPKESDQVALSFINVANRYMIEDQFDDAIRLCRRAIEISRSAGLEGQAGATMIVLAEAYRHRGDLDQALREIQESKRLVEPLAEAGNKGRLLVLALTLIREGEILGQPGSINLGRPKDAVAPFDRAFRICDDFAHQDGNDSLSRGRLATAGGRLGAVLSESEPARALAIYDHTLRHLGEIKNNTKARRDELTTLAASVGPLCRLGRLPDARQRLDDAFTRLRQLKLTPEQTELGPEAIDALQAQAEYQAAARDLAGAVETYSKLIGHVKAAKIKPENMLDDAVEVSNIDQAAARIYRQARRIDLASEVDRHRLSLWRHWDRKLPNNAFVRRQLEAASRP